MQLTTVDTARDRKRFIRLPWTINRGNPHWVPPLVMNVKQALDTKRNPFWTENKIRMFLAWKDGQPVGRIAAITIPAHNRKWNDTTGFFGFFEAIDDAEVFKALLDQAEEWVRAQGCDSLTGPVSPSTNYELGFLTHGFDQPPCFMMPYNPPYYNARIQEAGFTKLKDFSAYYIDHDSLRQPETLRRAMRLIGHGSKVHVRTANKKKFKSELAILHDIYNDSFGEHWGFVPMGIDEFQYMAKDMTQIMDPDLILILEYNGEPVGFLLALPDFNEVFRHIKNGLLFPFGVFHYLRHKNRVKSARVLTVAVKHDFQHLALGSFLYAEIIKRLVNNGYQHAEMSWVLEENVAMNKAAKLVGGRVAKGYRLYGRGEF